MSEANPFAPVPRLEVVARCPRLNARGHPWPLHILSRDGTLHDYSVALLRELGLTYEQAQIAARMAAWIPSPFVPFEAVAVNPALRSNDIWTYSLADQHGDPAEDSPATGRVHYVVEIDLAESVKNTTSSFAQWLVEQKRFFGLENGEKIRRGVERLFRDVLVCWLIEVGRWNVASISTQLRFMGLPDLGCSEKSDSKAAARKIVFEIRRLCRRIGKSPIFQKDAMKRKASGRG